ncbi:hypothetical protein AVEN_75013-1 [Araneus ventricosus]|uniref:Uncharacterized protein n=1 Tax=Araneus ventricosus TaxID=182803 RepID=A0A4Y2TT06_ARAVE|nr:hypothetical protein AVEN_75013-1 [Araneus ventricosus]
MWMYGNLRQEIIKVAFALTMLFQLEKDCDLVFSQWGYRQCGEGKLLQCTEHWSNYDGKKCASRNETSLNDHIYRYFTKAMTKNKVVNLNTLPLTSTAQNIYLGLPSTNMAWK